MDQVLRETRKEQRGEAMLREAVRETERKRLFPGQTRIPRSAQRAAVRAAGKALRRHPIVSALRWLANAEQNVEMARTYWNAGPHLTGGQSGTCPITDPLDFSDVRPGLPSPVCQTGQAVGPGYWSCTLGEGTWVKRAFAFNYNQVRWTLPVPGRTSAECLALISKAQWHMTSPTQEYMGKTTAGKVVPLSDPRSLAGVRKPAVLTAERPQVPTMYDPGAQPVWGTMLAPLALPVSLVTNREGFGPGVANERHEWGPDTKPEPKKLPITPDRPAQPRTKERKAIVGKWLYNVMGQFTEELDAVAALYPCIPAKYRKWSKDHPAVKRLRKAKKGTDEWYEARADLPPEFRGRKRPVSIKDKARLVYEHWEEIDLACASFNLLWERVEDAAYAGISKHSKVPFAKEGRRVVAGGRSFELSRQGDADLPNGSLPLGELKKWLYEQLYGKRT